MKTIRNIKRRLIAVFFAFIALLHFRNNGEGFSWKKVMTALASPFAVFSGCTTDPDEPSEAAAPVINNITVSGAGSPDVDGTYTVAYNAEITLGGNPTVEGGVYAWTYTTDPANKPLNFDQTAASPTVSGFEKGVTYTFELVVTKNGKTSEKKSVSVAVKENAAPTANAGTDQTVPLASNLTVTLDGAASSDHDGSIASYAWTCVSYTKHADVVTPYTAAEVTGIINNANTATATVDLRKAGTYVFQLTVTDNDGETDTDEVTVVVELRIAPQQVTVAAVPFSVSTYLDLEVTADNYALTGEIDSAFSSGDLSSITYTLSSTNPDRTAEQLSPYISNGKLSGSAYSDEGPIITQTFYYNGQEVGSRRFMAINCTGAFMSLRDADDPQNIILTALPVATLMLEKTVAEL